MAAVTSLSFSALAQSLDRKLTVSSSKLFASSFDGVRLRANLSFDASTCVRASVSGAPLVVHCMSTNSDIAPPVSETKLNFLKAYKRPIPSIYNNVLQELLVQQHLMKYKKTYRYDPVFALGFVTVYDQLMDGYPSDSDKKAIFEAYINALQEDPLQYRKDAEKLEEWARTQSASTLVEFSSREGEIEGVLKDISERAAGNVNFSYSRFFAVGLFRILELANASEPTVLEKLCTALNVNKRSVDRDLDVYRNLLSKLVQAKELLREYVEREKKKQAERAETPKANEAVAQCIGTF
ncbi:protein THYLAKOID FORMATION1, chloroplastic [Silene latifolia]|uniref:protein THYLAKOID FORMATION1, chloroplastic n=1 Tax=Silene latifolia TaxID=37657 RepID=UPI003D76FFE0